MLPFPDPSNPYLLDRDASVDGLGRILSQVRDGKECVVTFYSSKLSRPQSNCCVTRKELLAVVKSVEHFHSYLYCAKFTIRTDHAALSWLKSLKTSKGQVAGWLGRLEQFRYEVQHCLGCMHNNADSLSHCPSEPDCAHCLQKEEQVECRMLCVADGAQETEERWWWAQREDAELTPVIQWRQDSAERPSWQQVETESPAMKHLWQQWELLRLQDGMLQRRWAEARGRVSYWVVLVPCTLRRELLREMHRGIMSSHLGEKKTLSCLRQCFYWVGMWREVQEWCRACEICCAKKGPAQRTQAPLQLYQVGAPMECVAVDIAGHLPITTRGNRFICMAIDYFTNWPE